MFWNRKVKIQIESFKHKILLAEIISFWWFNQLNNFKPLLNMKNAFRKLISCFKLPHTIFFKFVHYMLFYVVHMQLHLFPNFLCNYIVKILFSNCFCKNIFIRLNEPRQFFFWKWVIYGSTVIVIATASFL